MKACLYISLVILWLYESSCSKSAFLETRPDNSLIVPQSLNDLQAMLDNDLVMNGAGNTLVPQLGETSADNYYVLDADFLSILSQSERNLYTWNANPYPGLDLPDWDNPYESVFYANYVLEQLPKSGFTPDQQEQAGHIKGSALFYRAHAFYQLAQVFAAPYDSSGAATEPGIPLRMASSINEKIERASLAKTYDQIIQDLQDAIALLPLNPLYKTRPSRPAAYGLLARVFQTLAQYQKAASYADSCIQLMDGLLDYNSLDLNASYPIPRFNKEVIWNCDMISSNPLLLGFVDSSLFASYDDQDLRKKIFFQFYNGLPYFLTGSYDENYLFAGIALDEIYLIRAESLARLGLPDAALLDLNTILQNRFVTGNFTPVTAVDANDALSKILVERRKELLYRGLRWTDLRRLNKEAGRQTILQRSVAGQRYTLPASDPRYTLLIPDNVISFNPGMHQNPR